MKVLEKLSILSSRARDNIYFFIKKPINIAFLHIHLHKKLMATHSGTLVWMWPVGVDWVGGESFRIDLKGYYETI